MNLPKLLDLTSLHFSEDELKTLCFELGVEFEDLGGVGKTGKARELIQFCRRNDKLQELVAALHAKRPDAEFESTLGGGSANDLATIDRSPWLGIEFWQDKQPCEMYLIDERSTRVSLRPSRFELRVPKLFDDPSIQVAAWTDRRLFDAVKAEVPIADIPFYQPGTGVADSTFGFGALTLSNEAHNYFYGQRLKASGDYYAVGLSTLNSGDESRPLAQQKAPLYLVVYVDLNRDEIVGNEEFEFFVLDF